MLGLWKCSSRIRLPLQRGPAAAACSLFHSHPILRKRMKGNDANPSSVSNASRHESDSGETSPTVSGDDNFKEFMRWALSWEMREIREVELENGLRGVEVRGVITTYVNPHPTGRGDRYVDWRLVDDYGAWHIDELTEGQLADYMADIEGGCISGLHSVLVAVLTYSCSS
ncbi:hypothetical protein BKA93DRAFT_154644 [Sparassis latifolia]